MFSGTLCSGISDPMNKDTYIMFCNGTGAEVINENDNRYFINPMLEPSVENRNQLKRVFSWLFG